jgi:hypothetical protein
VKHFTPDLFGHRPPYEPPEPPAQRHSQTSKAAAAQIKKAIGPLHKLILAHLKDKPSTDEEIMSALDMNGNTERPRRRELELMGKIEDSGKTRRTKSGRDAVIWRLT